MSAELAQQQASLILVPRGRCMTRQLNYPGHCTDLEGQLVGPTLLGQVLVITATFYDAARNVTEAFTRPATTDEIEAHRATVTPPAAFTP